MLLMTVWTGACAARASGPPALQIDRSTCSRCGMLISEPAFAAAIRLPDGHDELFDDIGCLVVALRLRSVPEARFWFHDAADGQWIEDATPVFVTSPALRTPMAGGIAAYRSGPAADQAASRLGGQVVTDLQALVGRDGSAR